MKLARKAVAVLVLIISLAATGPTAVAQQPVKQEEKNFEALRQGLRERGWIDGRNISFE